MTNNNDIHDLAIVGAGLSGSLLTVRILEGLASRAERLRILNCDRDGAFGRGVPYGERHTQPGFLLIEPVAKSTPPEFQQWLLAHRGALARQARESTDTALRLWAAQSADALEGGRMDDLYVPRRWFGRFAQEMHATALERARAAGTAEVALLPDECVDVRAEGDGFELRFRFAPPARAGLVVIAAGNIPRAVPAGAPGLADGYLHDLWQQGYAGLAGMLTRRFQGLDRPLDAVLLGSGATAGEVVYFLAHQPALLQCLRSLQVVSRSGYLAGGGAQRDSDRREIRADAAARPAAREYVAASRRLAHDGLLATRALDVSPVPRARDDGRLDLVDRTSGEPVIHADVIVNCSGSGDIDATASQLLNNLLAPGRPFRPNRLKAGFELRPGTYETAHVDGCFIIGPLLNEEAIETHVESIHGVYRAVDRLAPVLLERLVNSRGVHATALSSSARMS